MDLPFWTSTVRLARSEHGALPVKITITQDYIYMVLNKMWSQEMLREEGGVPRPQMLGVLFKEVRAGGGS